MARLVSLIVAVVASLAGGLLVLSQGGVLYRLYSLNFGRVGLENPDTVVPVAIAMGLLIVGALLVVVASATAGWSSLGVLVVGAVQVIVGALGTLLPPTLSARSDAGSASPVYTGLRELYRVLPDLTNGLYLVLPSGVVLAIGLANVLLGILAAARRRGQVASRAAARVVSLLVGLVVAVPAVAMIAVGGFLNYRYLITALRGVDPVGLALLGAGVVLLLVVVFAARWSSMAAIVGGLLVLGGGLATLFVPRAALAVVNRAGIGPDVIQGITVLGTVGGFALLGATLLGAGIGARIAGRVGARRSNWVAPHPGAEGDEPGRPWVTPGYTPVDGGGAADGVDRTSPTVVLPSDPPTSPGYQAPGSR
ncbi:hypothetical protein [Schumannella sp. 10F1B-5-1]|uniref:hypothetical protein n=1 Tax=Schumannella sp. 10F1B-5-1 TaxID=2590780 RepID=UPI001130CF53|nr:hypothetical protein [Schumannella sp. 10F1B-5-1]TPW73029.1 hypothetical protein FJ658_07205 [Schumannella sp. 10F1B-5-1]